MAATAAGHPRPGVTAQVASIDAASPGGPGDTWGGVDWRALTARNAARLLHRFPGAGKPSARTPNYWSPL